MKSLIKHPTAWVPIVMSATALAILLFYVAQFGTAQNEDEGTAAHLFQLLMAGQLPIIAFFAVKWLPQAPKQALQILALQFCTGLIPFILLFIFES